MVFSSFSSFLDPPINWPQSSNHNNHPHLQLQESGNLVSGNQVISHQFPPNPNPTHHHATDLDTSAANNDPARLNGSAAERARLAKNSQTEGALKCPRCDSSNTKFCYFNNYNLTQPRHFCKACRRYWTRGGALRNVPVGGGCRRNKKGKNGNSKSSSSSSNNNKQSSSMVNNNTPNPTNTNTFQQLTQFPFLPTLQNLTQLGGIGLNLAAINGNNGNNSSSSSLLNDLPFFHVGNGANTSGMINNNEHNIMTSLGSANHFTLFDRATGLYGFPNESNPISAPRVSQVKMEEANMGTNVNRPVSGSTSPANQSNYWTGLGFPGSTSNDNHHHHHNNLL